MQRLRFTAPTRRAVRLRRRGALDRRLRQPRSPTSAARPRRSRRLPTAAGFRLRSKATCCRFVRRMRACRRAPGRAREQRRPPRDRRQSGLGGRAARGRVPARRDRRVAGVRCALRTSARTTLRSPALVERPRWVRAAAPAAATAPADPRRALPRDALHDDARGELPGRRQPARRPAISSRAACPSR